MIITIDGPAGSGKSTAARNLARALGIAFLDTGATYRAVTLKALRSGADMQDERALAEVARRMALRLVPTDRGTDVLLDGEDVSRDIRSEQVSRSSHYAAGLPAVRQVLVELQRRLGRQLGSFVTEGRDQGSVVFPEADVKFYLVARPEERARRRHRQLLADGQDSDYEQVLKDIVRRDALDGSRDVAPLVRPEGAIVVDTSGNTIEQTTAELLRHVEAAR
jgi:cytidylate kinase